MGLLFVDRSFLGNEIFQNPFPIAPPPLLPTFPRSRLEAVREEQSKVSRSLLLSQKPASPRKDPRRGSPTEAPRHSSACYPLTETNSLSPGVPRADVEVNGERSRSQDLDPDLHV